MCYKANSLARVVVDEAHCASQWGFDYRPDFAKLGILRVQFPRTPLLALTATSTPKIEKDVIGILRMEGCVVVKGPVDRPKIQYVVSFGNSSWGELFFPRRGSSRPRA